MFPRKLLLLIIDFLFKNKATVLAPAGSPISNTKIIEACARCRAADAGAYRVHVICTSDNSILLIVWIENNPKMQLTAFLQSTRSRLTIIIPICYLNW